MDSNWYYVEGDKSVAPLTIADMTAILSRTPNARNVLVWQDGFSSWLKVEDVPELAQRVIRPPLIPVSAKPPPIPSSVPRDRMKKQKRDTLDEDIGREVVKVGETRWRRSSSFGWVLFLAVIIVLSGRSIGLLLSMFLLWPGSAYWRAGRAQ
jgi:hypothetical protein